MEGRIALFCGMILSRTFDSENYTSLNGLHNNTRIVNHIANCQEGIIQCRSYLIPLNSLN
jgi:hypothetical protein